MKNSKEGIISKKMKKYDLVKKFEFLKDVHDLREMLRIAAVRYGDRVAFTTKIKDKETKKVEYINTTYKEMLRQVEYLGTALVAMGFKDKRIAVIGSNSYNWVLCHFAACFGTGVVVPLDKGLQKDELESCINRSQTELLFYDEAHREEAEEIFACKSTSLRAIVNMDSPSTPPNLHGIEENQPMTENLAWLLRRGEELVNQGSRDFLDAPIDPDALGFLLFTSGTTSQSKAVMLTHRNFMSIIYGMDCTELLFEDDVNMMVLPLHHCYGMCGLLLFMTNGMKTVFCDGLKYVASNMAEYGVSVMMSVPLLLENMHKKIWKGIEKQGMEKKVAFGLALCNVLDKVGIHVRRKIFKSILDQMGGKMRFFINGASAIDPKVSKGLNDFGILTVQGYGLTESSPTISAEDYLHIRYGSVGLPIPGVEVKLLDVNDEGIGHLIAKGDNVMLGYYENQEATDEVLHDGWLYTGDLARIDKDGYIFICGRQKNVIVMKNGKNVFPEEIENLINTLPYVEESMVFPMEKHNEFVIWAKVVYSAEYLKDHGLTYDELKKIAEEDIEKFNDTMPKYKSVRHILLSDIPTIKTTTQKTKRRDEMVQILKELANDEKVL